MPLKPVVLCILDGWGLRDETENNAPALANTPNFDRIWAGIEPLVRSQPRPNHTDRAITSAVQRTVDHLVSFPEDARQDACQRVPSTCR